MVWQSPKSRIGWPLGGTCTVPGATASEIRSTLWARDNSGPVNRTPMRSESGDTMNGSLVKRRRLEALKRVQSMPRTTRKTGLGRAGLTQSYGADHHDIPLAVVRGLAVGSGKADDPGH